MKRSILVVVAVAILASMRCATTPQIHMNVKSYSDPERSLAATRSFMVVPLGLTMGDQLLEKELLFIVKQRLQTRGLAYDEAHPDVLVGLAGYIGPFEKYVPPATFYWPMPSTSTSTTTTNGMIGTTNVYGTSTTTRTDTQYVPYTTPGYTQVQYYRNIQLVMAKPETKSDGSSSMELVWSGIVESSGTNSDLLVVAPYLVDELLGEFPQRSGKPTSRVVVWTPPEMPKQ